MKLLLDTHAFIWWDSEPTQLSPTGLALLEDPGNTILLSVVSVWELQIKTQIGKLHLRLPLRDIVETQVATNQLEILPVHLPHTLMLSALPMHHRDPFDRLLIAQALTEDATLLSRDGVFSQYPIAVVW